MKFATFPKFALMSLMAGVLALILTGCGAVANNPEALTQGNWSMAATSNGSAGTFNIGCSLTQSGSSLAGTMYVVGSCISTSEQVAFTGSVSGNNITLASSGGSGQVITLSLTGTASSLTGTYSVNGGCDTGDSGTVVATPVASVTGTWNAPILNDGAGDPNVTLSMALTQATTPSANGTFALTGTLTYTGSTCEASGTISSASIAGPYLVINANTVDSDSSTGSITYTQGLLNSASTPTSMTGTYNVISDGGNLPCSGDLATVTFTKQ
jgi:hypothetical protein